MITKDDLKTIRERGYSDDEIWNTLSKTNADFSVIKERGYSLDEVASRFSGEAAQPAKPPEGIEGIAAGLEAGIGRAGLAFAKGTVGSVKDVANFLGANNPVSKKIAGVEEYLDRFTTAQAKQDKEEIARIWQDAESKGLTDKVVAGIQALAVSPETVGPEMAGYMAPAIIAGFATGGASVPVQIGAQATIGAVQAAGSIKGDIYEAARDYAREQGLDEVEADRVATEAQAYGGKNLDLILTNAGIGALAASTGAERIATRILTGRGKEVTKKTIGEFLKRTTAAGGVEAGVEGPQSGVEQLSINIARQRQGEDVDTFANVPQATTLGIAAGGIMGAGLRGVEFLSAEERAERDINRDADKEARNLSVPEGDTNAKVVVNEINRKDNAITSLQEELDTLEPTDPRAQQLRLDIASLQKGKAQLKKRNKEPLTQVEEKQAELATAIAAEPTVTPAPAAAELSTTITEAPVVSEEGAQVSEITPAPAAPTVTTPPAPEAVITEPTTPAEQTQEQVQIAQKQTTLVDQALKERGGSVFDVYDRLVNQNKTEAQVASEIGIRPAEVVRLKAQADRAIAAKLRASGIQPLGFIPKNPIAEFAEKGVREYFTKEGMLPKPVYQYWVKRNAKLSAEEKEAGFAIKDLYDGVRKVFGISKLKMIFNGLESVPPEFVKQLNDALAGEIDINTLPEPVRAPLTQMRQHIDAMSTDLAKLNSLPQDLSAKITKNLGTYITRSYKIFTDKNWINKIPTDKLNAARNFLYQKELKTNPKATIDDADRQLRNMLNDWASESNALYKRGAKLGAKDLSVLMKRAEVPRELREAMGENTNVIFNYANTIAKISRFVADQKFLDQVKKTGMNQFLYTKDNAPKGFNTQIAAEESRTMSPLNGLRTTPEIAKAFEEFGKGYDARENPVLFVLGWMNAVGKLNLTVGSVLTQMRNLLGQPAFFVFNGHYNWKIIREEIDLIAKENNITQDQAKRELVKQAAAQGLVNENAYAGELRNAFQDVGLRTFDDVGPDEFAKEFVIGRVIKKGVGAAQELYQKTDEFGKLVGWLNETQRVLNMNKGMDKRTAQSIAAERVRDTYPTYSQSSEALRLFRRQPFIGPFATFFYETFRTSYHNLRIAFEDINGPTAAHKKEGIQRLAGAMAQLSAGAFIVSLISQLASGISDSEEEDVRRMLPPWAADASLAWLPKSKDGTYNFINLSYINPYNAITDPFIAMLSGFARGDDTTDILSKGLRSFLSPFVDEQPVTASIVDVMRNRTETGKMIYNPQDDVSTKTSKIMLHVFGKTFTPGTVNRMLTRIIPAVQGETVGTRAPAPVREIAAEVTGIRFETLDMKSAFSSKAWEFSRAANDAERIFRDVATRRRRVTEQEQVDAYRRSEQARYETYNDMYKDYMAVRRAGATVKEARQLMRDIGISLKEATDISLGKYKPYEVSDDVKRRSELNGNVVPTQKIKALAKEMPTVLTDIKKERGPE